MLSVASLLRFAAICAAVLPFGLAGRLVTAQAAKSDLPEPVVIISQGDCEQLVARQVAKAAPDMTQSGHAEPAAVTAASSARSLGAMGDIAIDITTDVQQRFGLSPDSMLFKPEAGVGNVTVKPDGSVAVNGQSLTEAEAHMLAVLCRNPTPQTPPQAAR